LSMVACLIKAIFDSITEPFGLLHPAARRSNGNARKRKSFFIFQKVGFQINGSKIEGNRLFALDMK
jgi:hypothetical protein